MHTIPCSQWPRPSSRRPWRLLDKQRGWSISDLLIPIGWGTEGPHTISPTGKESSKRFKEEVGGKPSQVWGGTRKEDAWTNCCRCCQSKYWRTQWTQQETSRQSSDSGLEPSSKFGYPSFLRDFLWVWTSGKQCGSLYWLASLALGYLFGGWIWPSFA